MNKQRIKLVEQALSLVELALQDEETAFDALPESIQDSARGQQFQSHIESLEEAQSVLTTVIDDYEGGL